MNENIERTGKVIAIGCDGVAQISLTRPTSCAHCGSRGTCGSGAAKEHIVSLRLTTQPEVGQDVTVTTSPGSVVLAALLGYALPAACLLIGAIGGEMRYGTDEAAVAGAVLGLLAGFVAVRAVSAMTLRSALSTHSPRTNHEHFFQSGES